MNKHHCINLNIHYTQIEKIEAILHDVYCKMDGWRGYKDGFPSWYGNENDEKYINVSVEPSGLQFSSRMDEDEWFIWIEYLKMVLTNRLGFEVGEPEDGLEFHI